MRRMIRLNYIPVEWGVKDEEFEREGFTLTKTTNDYAEAYKWLKDNAEDNIGG